MEDKAVESARWLYGGNYNREQIEDFNKVIQTFSVQAYLEQEHLLEILKSIKESDRIWEDEEILYEIDEILKAE